MKNYRFVDGLNSKKAIIRLAQRKYLTESKALFKIMGINPFYRQSLEFIKDNISYAKECYEKLGFPFTEKYKFIY
jgi:hypothetical protein